MAVHIALLIYISAIGLCCYLKKPYTQRKNRIFIILSMGAIFLVQALRSQYVGWDTIRYVRYFNLARAGFRFRSMEMLFTLLLSTVAKISDSSVLFLSCCSLLIVIGIGIFIDQNTDSNKSAFWAVFFFVTLSQYFSTMNLIRQGIAMAIGCNIYTILHKNQSLKAYIICLILTAISTLFHTTGLLNVLLIVPFLIKVDYKKIFIAFLAALSVYFAYPIILQVFLNLFPKYGNYIGSVWDVAGSRRYYIILAFFELIMIALYCVYINPNIEENQSSYKLLFICIYSFGLILLQRKIVLADRLSAYFEIFLVLLIPQFLEKWNNTQTRIALKSIVLLLGWVFYIYYMSISTARGCVPYTFFWQI